MKVPTCTATTSPSHHNNNNRHHHNNNNISGILKPVQFKMATSVSGDSVGSSYSEQLAIKSCFKKLRQLVPSLQQPGARGLSETELIQHVIDYIHSLEEQLDSHPVHRIMCAAAVAAVSGTAGVEDTTADLCRLELSATSPQPSATSATMVHRAPLRDRQQMVPAGMITTTTPAVPQELQSPTVHHRCHQQTH